MRTFGKISKEFPAFSKLPPLSRLESCLVVGCFFPRKGMAVGCQFIFSYAQVMNVTTNGAEACVKLVQEVLWRLRRRSKRQGAEAALPCGPEPGEASCRLFPAVPPAFCLIHSKVHHLSAFLSHFSCPHLIRLYCEPPEPQRDRIKSPGALPWLVPACFPVRGRVAPAAGRGGERQQASLCPVHISPGLPVRRCSALHPG